MILTSALCLRDFSIPVPSCPDTTPFSALIELFGQGAGDRIVAIGQQQTPIGLVSLERCFAHWLTQGRGQRTSHQEPLGLVSLLESVTVLPESLSLHQFWLHVQCAFDRDKKADRPTYVLVDVQGHYAGVLDYTRLLEHLTMQSPEPLSLADSQSAESPWNPFLLDAWIQLLDRLPFPTMLQTNSGDVLVQNQVWQEQFQGLRDPERVRQEADALLDAAGTAGSELDRRWVPLKPSAPSVCHLGTVPHSCICICPTQSGEERIWQFLRVRLMCPQQESMDSSQERVGVLCGQPFHLGTIAQQSRSPATPSTHVPTGDREVWSQGQAMWLVLAQDVTAQQHLSQELAAKNADLVHLNRLKDEFLACISHELKTPLTAVLGLSSLLKDQALGELNERQLRYTRLIHRSGRHLMTVVNDILDLTRIETGQLELNFEPIRLKPLFQQAYVQAQQRPSGSQPPEQEADVEAIAADLTLDIEPGLEVIVADKLRLQQMLCHLLSNAIKFTPTGGNIGLRANRWAGWIALTVWDTGIGIPAEKQHLIFQKFQQLENPLTRQFEGAGLGLVLTQRLARLHGGDVSFVSKEGEGSQFTVLLPPIPPVHREEMATTFESGRSPKEFRKPRPSRERGSRDAISTTAGSLSNSLVLVVGAAMMSIEGLLSKLTRIGYQVAIARSGTEAIEKARRLQPGMVFLDPNLPLLSGWDVLTLLKSEAKTCHIPAVVLGTRAEQERAEKLADEFLSLPVEDAAIERCLAHSIPEQPAADPKLTILQLNLRSPAPAEPAPDLAAIIEDIRLWTGQLNATLHQHHYRILEADDLEQAELLARIWQPHTVLLMPTACQETDVTCEKSVGEGLRRLSQQSILASIPLIATDPQTVQCLHNLPQEDFDAPLQVLPCLAADRTVAGTRLPDPQTLLQVIQVAAGVASQPSVLIVDIAHLPDLSYGQAEGLATAAQGMEADVMDRSPWLKALVQYMDKAGFRSVMGQSWAQVWRQILLYSVDLVLLWVRDDRLEPKMIEALSHLRHLERKPPILILDHRREQHLRGEVSAETEDSVEVAELLAAIAQAILPGDLAMAELLEHVERALTL